MRPATVDDVIAAVNFARRAGLVIAVRGGGHNPAGKSTCDGGMVIDLALMRSVWVDPAQGIARAAPGLRLGEFDRATQAFGLATTMGVVPDTGIAGLTLGGGYGWLAGKYGLACDNLLSVDLVTAEGRLIAASAEENTDLFWAVRGAGANFGIVTSFQYVLHEQGPVLGGMLLYPFDAGREVLQTYNEFAKPRRMNSAVSSPCCPVRMAGRLRLCPASPEMSARAKPFFGPCAQH
ncbi:MAG TPA: FAD-dependent oxidoreductase [Dehalococcoidia bacterium]|nr:FAD-dependent oxidoreductase [Dehalococcoidia bacterium]